MASKRRKVQRVVAVESPRWPDESEREGLVFGSGKKFYGMPEHTVGEAVPEDFRDGDMDRDGY